MRADTRGCHTFVLSSRVAAIAIALAVAGLLTGPADTSTSTPDLRAYAGLGTWLDVYDRSAWRQPEHTVGEMAAHGVTTLFLQTGNSRQTSDLVRPKELARLLDVAHAAGLQVVAWYLPSLVYPTRDLRRVLAALRFRTPSGGRFDSFALDIEASDVRSVRLRNTRLATLSSALRRAAGPTYPLGAIVPSAVGMELHPTYWPDFPYGSLLRSYNVFLPMAYFTYHVTGRAATARYVARSVQLLREAAGLGVAVHVVGGTADRARPRDVAGFMDAVGRCDVLGFSLYDSPTTSEAAWTTLDGSPTTASGECSAPPVA